MSNKQIGALEQEELEMSEDTQIDEASYPGAGKNKDAIKLKVEDFMSAQSGASTLHSSPVEGGLESAVDIDIVVVERIVEVRDG